MPPGFCLTTRALEKHLELNPELMTAIRDIEAANEDYNEDIFKEKCKRCVFLPLGYDNIVGRVFERRITLFTELQNFSYPLK